MEDKVTSRYLQQLAAIYHRIDSRGMCISLSKMDAAVSFVDKEIARNLEIASKQWGCKVFIGAANAPAKDVDAVNLNATQGQRALLKKLQDIGYKIPKITKKTEAGEYEAKYSTSELALQKMLVTNQYGFVGGDPAIRAILAVREMGKLKSSYFNCRFYQDPSGNVLFLSNYNICGTLTGRRSCRKHTFGFGGNAQTFPKHGSLAKAFRECIVARPGNLFLNVDQKGAELWPVYALAGDQKGIHELQAGVNKHAQRAAFIFGPPIAEPVLENQDAYKDAHPMEYYLGKKAGHANNYGMKGQRFSDSLAQEGHSITPTQCQAMLDKANRAEPLIDEVFHKYVKDQIFKTRILQTPFGRERQFLGLRPNDSNYKIFNEAYSWIPQSTVGDNTGFAVRYLETESSIRAGALVNECHDSVTQDIPANSETIYAYLCETECAFHRTITFYNGISLQIPIEAEIGYDLATTVKIKEPFTLEHVKEALEKLNHKVQEKAKAESQVVEIPA